MKRFILIFVMILGMSSCIYSLPGDRDNEDDNKEPPIGNTDPVIPSNDDEVENEEPVIIETVWEYESLYEDDFYNWIKETQLENGLQVTLEGGTLISLYDNALAALVYTMYGDYERAEKIFDFFDNRIDTELKDEYGGFAQFRNPEGNITDGVGRRWLGDNAWLLVAINQYHKETNTNKYNLLASELELWIRSLQEDDGSLMSGYDSNGQMIAPVTEAMIDSFNAVHGFDSFHTTLLAFLESSRYDTENHVMMAWPTNPMYRYALDVSSWAFLGMEHTPASVLDFAETKFFFKEGETIGYCMDEDKDTLWPEGTLQMATAYIMSGEDKYAQATYIIENMEEIMITSSLGSEYKGLPYASVQATGYGNGDLWIGSDTMIHLSSNAWYLFAVNGFNPFDAGYEGKIPTSEVENLFYK